MKIILTLYIDDLLIFYNKLKVIKKLKEELKKEFEMTDLREVKYILRIYFKRNFEEGTLRIH